MTKKLTTEEFIKKAQILFGNKFDYSKVIYTRAADKAHLVPNNDSSRVESFENSVLG